MISMQMPHLRWSILALYRLMAVLCDDKRAVVVLAHNIVAVCGSVRAVAYKWQPPPATLPPMMSTPTSQW
jgi:hypothetical protein